MRKEETYWNICEVLAKFKNSVFGIGLKCGLSNTYLLDKIALIYTINRLLVT